MPKTGCRLRQDNADQRLTARGFEVGLVGNKKWQSFAKRWICSSERDLLAMNTIHSGVPIARLLKRPEVNWDQLSPEIVAAAPAEIWDLSHHRS